MVLTYVHANLFVSFVITQGFSVIDILISRGWISTTYGDRLISAIRISHTSVALPIFSGLVHYLPNIMGWNNVHPINFFIRRLS